MTPPGGDPVRRWRTGGRASLNIGKAAFLLVVAGAFAAVGVANASVATGVVAAVVGLLGLWFLGFSLAGLRPVEVRGDPPVLSVPTFSPVRGFRRRTWPAGSGVRVDLVRCGIRFPYFAARFTDDRGELRSLSVTCPARRLGVDLADREHTPAGRAVAEIRAALATGQTTATP